MATSLQGGKNGSQGWEVIPSGRKDDRRGLETVVGRKASESGKMEGGACGSNNLIYF